jgi:hypothetical protein
LPYPTPTATTGVIYLLNKSLLILNALDVPFFNVYHFYFVYGATVVFYVGYYNLLPMY